LVRNIVEPAAGCVIAVAKEGFGTGSNESEALRALSLTCGIVPRTVELYRSETLSKGAVWVDEAHFLCWQGDHENPILYARLADGRRIDGVVELEPEPAAPTSWAAKMIARRKAT